MDYRKLFRLYLRKWKQRIEQYLNCSNYISFSPWDRDQIGIKLRTKHVVYLKLTSFTSNKDVYVNRLESVFFDTKCVFYRTELHAWGIPLNWILKVLMWNKPKDTEKNEVICLVIMFTSKVMPFKMSEIANFIYFLLVTAKI